jgi:hypothetical protein
MPKPERFHSIVATIVATMPVGGDLSAVRVDESAYESKASLVITVWTKTLSLLIGPRGATAESIRKALSETLHEHAFEFHMHDAQLPNGEPPTRGPDDPPSAGPGGVREPRRPSPNAPSTLGLDDERK